VGKINPLRQLHLETVSLVWKIFGTCVAASLWAPLKANVPFRFVSFRFCSISLCLFVCLTVCFVLLLMCLFVLESGMHGNFVLIIKLKERGYIDKY
jgi:hypothetical protein